MTEKLYYKDGYLKETTATVKEVRDNSFILDKTIFYPEGGGQRGDRGFFGPHKVDNTIKDENGEILHLSSSLPKVGETYSLVLDWENRIEGMREHTAQHLISSILFHSYGISTVAVHEGDGAITIETDRSEIDDDILLDVEKKTIEHICENRRVWQEEKRREDALEMNMRRSIKVDSPTVLVVFIDSLDAVACGGVHLSSTGEIGEVSYLGKESIRGHVRVIWSIGEKSREIRLMNSRAIKRIGTLLSSPSSLVTNEVERMLEENKELKRKNRELEKALAIKEIEKSLIGSLVIETVSHSVELLLDFVSSYPEKEFFIIENGLKKGFLYYGKKERFMLLKEKANLKGGGREPLFRGTYSIEIEELIEIAKDALL